MDTNIDPIILLEQGKVTILGEFVWGSNYTFLVTVNSKSDEISAVYKPIRGERPLWDFPRASLSHREVAAFLVSKALGWQFVPPTVYRKSAPLGPGSLQLYIEHDPEYHYFTFTAEDRQRLKQVALFDILVNNADRKGSHVLKDKTGHLWLIDHGVCFHVEEKLRTVIWDFVGETIPETYCSDLVRFLEALGDLNDQMSELSLQLSQHLSRAEIRALGQRAETLIKSGRFPPPDPYRRAFPWPQI